MNLNEITAKFGIKVDGSGFAAIRKELNTIAAGFRAIKSEAQAQTAEFRLQTLQQRELERQEKASLRRRAQNWREFRNSVRGAMLGIAGLTYGLIAGTRGTREMALEYRDFARQTGLSIEKLQQYQTAAAETGSSLTSSQVAKDIQALQQRLVDVEFGQGNLFPYKMLGISAATKDSMVVIEALRRSIKGLDDARALNLIQKVGLTPDWLHLLRQSREEFDRLQSIMMSREQISSVTRLSLAFRQTGFALKNMKDQAIAFLSGGLTVFMNNLKDMAMDLSAMLKEMYNSPEAMRRFAMGLSVISMAIAPLTSTIIGLLLVLEDLYVASKGGESLFNWDKNAFSSLVEGLQTVLDILTRIFDVMTALGKFGFTSQKSIENIVQGKDVNEGLTETESWLQVLNPATWGSKLEGVMLSGLKRLDPMGLYNQGTIVNNFDISGLAPEMAGAYVTNINQAQQTKLNMQSDINATYSQMSMVGG